MYPILCCSSGVTCSPSTLISPLSGPNMPTIILMVVVLPAPLGPSSPKIDPLLTLNERPLTATNPSNLFVTASTSTEFIKPPFRLQPPPQVRRPGGSYSDGLNQNRVT